MRKNGWLAQLVRAPALHESHPLRCAFLASSFSLKHRN